MRGFMRLSQEMQLICSCCRQPYHGQKTVLDQLFAILVGTEKYSICPLCTQAVPRQTLRTESYRRRAREQGRRLQRICESATRKNTTINATLRLEDN
jgi:hypothetical protein